MDKIEMKHLAPYLPYSLLLKGEDTGLVKLSGIGSEGFVTISDPYANDAGMYVQFDEYKPILRPLIDLMKPLDKGQYAFKLCEVSHQLPFNGTNKHLWTSKIPKQDFISVLNKYNDYSFEIDVLNGDLTCYNNGEFTTTDNIVDIAQFYFQHHFDVFHLIEKGLAIDINTIPELCGKENVKR